jgi:hypothetical protein
LTFEVLPAWKKSKDGTSLTSLVPTCPLARCFYQQTRSRFRGDVKSIFCLPMTQEYTVWYSYLTV